MPKPVQYPYPGQSIVMSRGDVLEVSLILPDEQPGNAWLRTNIGHAELKYREIVDAVEEGRPRLFQAWFDIPMIRRDDLTFKLHLPLLEVGNFEAKAYFVPEPGQKPVWADGENTRIKVEPAEYAGNNVVYNAFIRQFGPAKSASAAIPPELARKISELDAQDFIVLPPSGKFRDFLGELDFVIGELGCRIIQLLPIHPVPTTYGRMGRFGSAFASLDFFDVDASMAVFDKKTTPMQQFEELVDAAHARGARIFIDIAVNHTGWGSKVQEEHPEWFARESDGSFYCPRAWGNIWADLVKLDYARSDLAHYIAGVFLFWCQRGVDGFRCDAGYKIPVAVWEYIVAKVRLTYPNTIFLLEGLGGEVETTRDLLSRANLNWAYSELFQNYDRNQIDNYLIPATNISETDGLMIHFAETHDNDRLAAKSQSYAKMRTALAALTSVNGGWGFANGVEWFANEKISVHEANSMQWGAGRNQVKFIRRLNQIIRNHPAFHRGAKVKMIHVGTDNCIAIKREYGRFGGAVLILVNLDHQSRNVVRWNPVDFKADEKLIDALTGRRVTPTASGGDLTVHLAPAQVLCLGVRKKIQKYIDDDASGEVLRDVNVRQALQAKALDLINRYWQSEEIFSLDLSSLAAKFLEAPVDFACKVTARFGERIVMTWTWPVDLKREVLVPPNFLVVMRAPYPFRIQISEDGRILNCDESLPGGDGFHFVILPPRRGERNHVKLNCRLTVFEPGQTRHFTAHLLCLAAPESVRMRNVFERQEILKNGYAVLSANENGAATMVHVSWGVLTSRYDAILAANLNNDFPDNRRVLLTRCRIWSVYQDFSYPIDDRTIVRFDSSIVNEPRWLYAVPAGNGTVVRLLITLVTIQGRNAVILDITRIPAEDSNRHLDDAEPVKLIFRPDLEDRDFHTVTKAYAGPEEHWKQAVNAGDDGFTFAPNDDHALTMNITPGAYTNAPEWTYLVHYPFDEERGLDAHTDLFSPGYFSCQLKASESVCVHAVVSAPDRKNETLPSRSSATPRKWRASGDRGQATTALMEALQRTMRSFIVRRHKFKTVIAGYPWFLDWGRDTLICVRGLIAAELFDDVRAILIQFGEYEDHGTLPNMIRGADTGNRDTSDAPLWFLVACDDYMRLGKDTEFPKQACGSKTIGDVVSSIIISYAAGTPNGIRMDPDSGLIFSPSHFTWMDTNYPAATPRQGYPIEIQALWHAGLKFAARILDKPEWQALANKVKQSIASLYFLKRDRYLADCLLADPGQSAAEGTADDALRPNQLLAVTLDVLEDPRSYEDILVAAECLLVPGAIRSLADRRVETPLPVRHHDQLLNDPSNPYWGRYEGDEDTRRKPAYHNGTAWTWVFPWYAEAWFRVYGERGRDTAAAILGSSTEVINAGCINQVPEILDGDHPHTQRGCRAQAWGATELYRVLRMLQ